MSAWLEEFMEKHQRLPDLAAWSGRSPDGKVVKRSLRDSLTARHAEHALYQLEDAAETLAPDATRPARLTWIFQHFRIHVAFRTDKARLALFVENRPHAASALVEMILEEFLHAPTPV
jgi:hypothetical protein